MTSTTLTERWRHIELVLDRSGSMAPIKTATEQGVRAFLAEQWHVPGLTTVSLTQFDHEVEQVFSAFLLDAVPGIALEPRGKTALLDALGLTITRTRDFVHSIPKPYRPDEIITVVLTDGLENASKVFHQHLVRNMISELQAKKRLWKFVLLGASSAVHALAEDLGIDSDTAIQYDHDLIQDALPTAGRMLRRGAETGDYGFTSDERRTTRR